MDYKSEKKQTVNWGEVSVLSETYEPGKPDTEDLGRWRQKMSSRDEKLRYLKTAERYWYAEEGYGSEKRKNPA